MTRLRVLLSAFACEPERGSEQGVGWNVATRLARQHDVTVLYGGTEETPRRRVEAWLARHGTVPGATFQFVPPSSAMRWLDRAQVVPGLYASYYAAYRLWQRAAFGAAIRLHSDQPFDVAHQLTYIGYREPGYLWRLGIPFLWGPIGGASDEPWPFIRAYRPGVSVARAARRIANQLQMRLAYRPRAAARRAARIWTVTPADHEMVTRLWHRPAAPLLAAGAEPVPDRRPVQRAAEEPLRLAWSGQLIAIKQLSLVLRALARLDRGAGIELAVVGDGPEASRSRRLARELRVEGRVRWLGWVARELALRHMASSHALVFSSVKEGSPSVVLEALALGLPVVCHDACGMGVAVTPACGLKVPLRDPATSVGGFARAIARLRDEPGLLPALSSGALARAQELTWDRNIEVFATAYRELVVASRPALLGAAS